MKKTCPICNTVFDTNKTNRKYCSASCQIDANRRNAKKHQREKHPPFEPQYKTCPYCKKEFFTSNGRKVYCSIECKTKAQTHRKKEQRQLWKDVEHRPVTEHTYTMIRMLFADGLTPEQIAKETRRDLTVVCNVLAELDKSNSLSW